MELEHPVSTGGSTVRPDSYRDRYSPQIKIEIVLYIELVLIGASSTTVEESWFESNLILKSI